MKRFYYGTDGVESEKKWVFCVDHDADSDDSGWIYRGPSYAIACQALSDAVFQYDVEHLTQKMAASAEMTE